MPVLTIEETFVALYAVLCFLCVGQLIRYYLLTHMYKHHGWAIYSEWSYVWPFDFILAFATPGIANAMGYEGWAVFIVTYSMVVIKVFALQRLYESEIGVIPTNDIDRTVEAELWGKFAPKFFASLFWPLFSETRDYFYHRILIKRSKK